MALTELAVRSAKSNEKPYKLADGSGLHLLVTAAGGKLWRFKYRFGGREKQLALGRYPEMSLREAREKRDEAKLALRQRRDPGTDRRLDRQMAIAARTQRFEAVARQWHNTKLAAWTVRHAADVIGSLERLVFPRLGALHVNEIPIPLTTAYVSG